MSENRSSILSRIFKKVSMKTLMICLTVFYFILTDGSNVNAQGDLLLTPRRLVFEGSKKSLDVNLSNVGQDTSTYSISIVQIRMTDNGGFETITEPDPGQNFAEPYLRYFPRSVTLGPNESQAVKVQIIKTGNLPSGEFRSHMYFRAMPKPSALGEATRPTDSSTISIQLKPIFGITIPILIRIGQSDAKVNLSDLSFEIVNDTVPRLNLSFNRTGNMSVFGDLAIDHVSPQGKVTRVGTANGIAVYTPNALRRFQLILEQPDGVNYKSGTLRVTYSAPSDVKPQRFAEAEYKLQ